MRSRSLRLTVVATFAVWALAGCDGCSKDKKTSGGTEVADFWSWFRANEVRLADTATSPEAIGAMKEITTHLQQAAPGLIAELGIDRNGGRQTVVISANGNFRLFPLVKSVAEAAPTALTRWQVLAFRPRRGADQQIEFEGKSYPTADFTFRETGRADGKLDIDIYVRGLTAENNETMMKLALLLLDSSLGEYDAQTKLGNVNLSELPTDGGAPNTKPLTTIGEAADSL